MKDAIEAAHSRIAPHVRKTVCRSAPSLSEAVGGDVFVKLENSQHTGSFKLRGVVNKILTLPEEDSRKLLVAASTGNHAAAFAHALQVFGLRGMLFMPKNSSNSDNSLENYSSGAPTDGAWAPGPTTTTATRAFRSARGH
jgi:threonine dehydratase